MRSGTGAGSVNDKYVIEDGGLKHRAAVFTSMHPTQIVLLRCGGWKPWSEREHSSVSWPTCLRCIASGDP